MTELMFYPEPPYNYRRPWNHRLNQEYDNRFYHLYCVDADGYREWDRHFTNIVAVTGPGTAWRDGRTTIDHGKLGSDTVLLVEVAPSLGIEWMEPRDLDIRTMPREIGHPQGICANFPFLGAMIGFADGEVWTLRNDTPFCALAPFLTVEGAHLHDREELLGPYVVHRQPPGFRIPFP